MPDPLSIAAGIVGLLEVTGSVVGELRKFHRASSVIDRTITELLNDVERLQGVLESMRHTFAVSTAASETETGHIGTLWKHISRSIVDGKEVLDHLRALILNVNKETKFLDDHRKQVRLNRAQPQIEESRMHIQSFKDGLGLSLQAIILWNQETQQNTTSQVLPNLSELHADVHRIALDLNQKIDLLESRMRAGQAEFLQTEVNATRNLKECVRSAASTISSASTVRKYDQDVVIPEGTIYGSDFDDCSSVERHVRHWMDSYTIRADAEDELTVRPPSIAGVLSLEGSDGADSDAELETEITVAMMKSGKQKLDAGNSKVATRLLLKCLERLETANSRQRSASTKMQMDVIEDLFLIYSAQECWNEAQQMCIQKLRIHERCGSNSKSSFIDDVLRLAQVNMLKGDFIDAELHARRALKEAKKLDRADGVSNALGLLISLCKERNDIDAIEAYTVMLADMNIGTPPPDVLDSSTRTLHSPDPAEVEGGSAHLTYYSADHSFGRSRNVALAAADSQDARRDEATLPSLGHETDVVCQCREHTYQGYYLCSCIPTRHHDIYSAVPKESVDESGIGEGDRSSKDESRSLPSLGLFSPRAREKRDQRILARMSQSLRISVERFYDALDRYSILVIDFRPREMFDRGHIYSRNIMCVDPDYVSKGITAYQLRKRMILSPGLEQDMFANPSKYDLVVYYDTKTCSENYLTQPTSDSEMKLKYLHEALCDSASGRPLRNPPMLLTGGIEAWVDLVGPQALMSSNTAAKSVRSRTRK